MLTTEQSSSAVRTRAAYQLRLHGGTEVERLIDVPSGKHSVGSGPRCQIRLDVAGVGAMECLLVCDRAGLRVRRWSDKTLLNGQPFEEANLVDGDVLSVGPIEMVVVGSPEGETALEGYEQGIWANDDTMRSVCDAIDDIFLVDEASSQTLQPADQYQYWQSDRAARPTQRIIRAAASAPVVPSMPPDSVTKATVRRRSRRALEVVRRQRRDHDELMARVGELEQLLGQALADSHVPQPEHQGERTYDSAGADQRITGLETELGSLRYQLATRDGELQQARYSIDVLERQLIDSQHTMHAFADERIHWEEQFNEIESRLAKYVERIQDLEQQLDGSQMPTAVESASAAAPINESGIDWELEVGQAVDAELPALEEQAVEQVATAVEEWPQEESDRSEDWQEIVEEPATETSESDVETAVAPPPEAAIESTDASKNQAPAESELVATDVTADDSAPTDTDREVEEALEHLRGVSIWREEPASDAKRGAGENTNVMSQPAGTHENSAPVSFLDRYAHIFPDDDAPSVPKMAEDNTAPLKEALPPPEVHADEESVEQYMSKLLVRMRGGPAGSSTVADPSEKRPDYTDRVVQPTASQVVDDKPEQPMLTNLDEMKAKSTPEHPSDMAAMRALANQSARHALSLHAARKLRRTAITRVIVTALGASVSVYLLLNSSTWRSLSFAAGCAAGFAALYWGILTMGTLLKGFQLGAFDEYEEEVAPEKSLNPPLPIDVEEAPQEETASGDSASGDSASGDAAAGDSASVSE